MCFMCGCKCLCVCYWRLKKEIILISSHVFSKISLVSRHQQLLFRLFWPFRWHIVLFVCTVFVIFFGEKEKWKCRHIVLYEIGNLFVLRLFRNHYIQFNSMRVRCVRLLRSTLYEKCGCVYVCEYDKNLSSSRLHGFVFMCDTVASDSVAFCVYEHSAHGWLVESKWEMDACQHHRD